MGDYELGHNPGQQTLLEVDELPVEDAVRLIESHQPDSRFPSPSEREAAEDIANILGGFTLAVEVVAVYLAESRGRITCAALRERLEGQGLLSGFEDIAKATRGAVNHREKLIGATLGPTLDLLSPEESLVLAYAALLPPDAIAVPWLRPLIAKDHPELGKDAEPGYDDPWLSLVDHLLGLRLLQVVDVDPEVHFVRMVRMHRLVGELVRKRNCESQDRHAEVVVRAALTALLAPDPLEQRARNVQRLAVVHRVAREAVANAMATFLDREMEATYKEQLRHEVDFQELVDEATRAIAEQCIEAEVRGDSSSAERFIAEAPENGPEGVAAFEMTVLVSSITDCYIVLGIVHLLWRSVPRGFRDFISMPRPDMYRALQTVLVEANSGILVKTIIQTSEMTALSDAFVAAETRERHARVFEAVEQRQRAADLPVVPVAQQLTLEERLLLRTPGDEFLVVELGATVLDVAFHVHSEMFLHCSGAIVDGQTVGIGHVLKYYDHVKVLSDPNVEPQPSWSKLVRSARAQRVLGRWLHRRERARALQDGSRRSDP
jgi:hypothetical protein